MALGRGETSRAKASSDLRCDHKMVTMLDGRETKIEIVAVKAKKRKFKILRG
jgi:hypothetical protein